MDREEVDIAIEKLRSIEGERPSDDVLALLSDSRVRCTFLWLYDHPDTTLDRLTEIVTGIEAARAGTAGDRTDRDEISIDLYHRVLPKLDARGYIEFNHENKTVSTVTVPSEITSYLDLEDGGTDPRK